MTFSNPPNPLKYGKFHTFFFEPFPKGRRQKNRKLRGFCPKFIDPLTSPPDWDKKNRTIC